MGWMGEMRFPRFVSIDQTSQDGCMITVGRVMVKSTEVGYIDAFRKVCSWCKCYQQV